MGIDLVELDVPASWGRQALKYARTHGLERACLEEAFASSIAIEAFRASLGIEGAKGAVNMLIGEPVRPKSRPASASPSCRASCWNFILNSTIYAST